MEKNLNSLTERESPNKNHKDIPGNPSTATSSKVKLSDRSKGQPLRVLSEEDWEFWVENGYVIIKDVVPREQALRTAAFLWEFEEKTQTTLTPGILRPVATCK